MAVVTGVERAVRIHIDRGDDLNARDEKGQTPLMLSAARDNAAICQLLLAAGADARSRDPSGHDALAIARAAGALDAASVIEAACNPLPTDRNGPVDLTGSAGSRDDASGAGNGCDKDPPRSTVLIPGTSAPEGAPIAVDDGSGFDLGGWEAEEDQVPPESDTLLSLVAAEVQTAITEHQPIDTSADWEDFEAILPDRAAPLPRVDDAEARERLRMVLLRAIREGSVPHAAIAHLTCGEDGEPDTEAATLLVMVVNDLGAEIDERFEYSAPHESFEVFVAPDEKPDEEDVVADALAFVDDLAARRNEPLRLYQRDFQREALLTAEAEVALGQAMERGLEKALDALAAWPSGVAATLQAARQVATGARPLRSMSSGLHKEAQDAHALPLAEVDADTEVDVEVEALVLVAVGESGGREDDADSQSGLEAIASTDELAEFCANAELLSGLPVGASQNTDGWLACRGALASLGLARGFLLELADSGLAGEPDSAHAFGQAMRAYRRARDRMTLANLKLVNSIAKRYLFSGVPLDDLLQEGNTGLIKAVDRFDWRKGFKFSTYATWWIRQQVGRFVADKGMTIRLPVHVYEKTQRIAQAARAFELRHGNAPTLEEVAALVDLPIRRVEILADLSQEPLPLHDLSDLDELIADYARAQFVVCDPIERVEEKQLRESLDDFLSTLKRKEENIIRMRYGIGVPDSLTLEEVGARLHVTRERIRQIEVKALRRLKHPIRLARLRTALGIATALGAEQSEAEAGDADDKTGADVANGAPPEPKPTAYATPTPEERTGSEPALLNQVLEQAQDAGILVEDYLEGEARRLWVHITEAPDSRSRKLVRQLMALGFEFWPGKGYWR